MGHLCQFVWGHQTHPIIFVAHPEHKSPQVIGRFSPSCYYPWCLCVSRGVNHSNDVAADNQRPTHAPLRHVACVSVQMYFKCDYERVNVFTSENVYKSVECAFTAAMCVYYLCAFVQSESLCWLSKMIGMQRSTGSEQRMQLEAWPSVQRTTHTKNPLTCCLPICVCVCVHSKISWIQYAPWNQLKC